MISGSSSLDDALRRTSPRLSPRPTPWTSLLIHGGVAGLWLLLLARGFLGEGLFSWSVGIVYIGYDTALQLFVVWMTRGLARAKPADAIGRTAPQSLGVIVAAHNEAAVLSATLTALFDQSEPPDLIVIADDGSTDATAALLGSEFALLRPDTGCLSEPSPRHPSLRWLPLPHRGKPETLNTAILAVGTEIVLTVDADTLLERGALAAMRHAFALDPQLVAATGILRPVCGPTAAGRLFEWFQTYEYVRNFLSRYAWMQLSSLLLISGAFAGYRRHAVVAVGGFDPACLVEDYELIHRLRRHSVLHGLGWTTAVVGESRALTEAPGSVGGFLRQRRRWFGGFLQTQYWYREMVGNPAFGWLGLLMLPVKAADTLQPIYGLTAVALLVGSAVSGRLTLVAPAFGVIGAKVVIDYAFHLWSIHLYRRWTGPAASVGLVSGLLAATVEPFSFQLLRHLGAALGWVVFFTGARQWGAQRRFGFAAATRPELPPVKPLPR